MRILLVSDAWPPQVNGVVRTLQRVRAECEALGHQVEVVAPDLFATVPCPTYPEIRLALQPGRRIGRTLDGLRPDCVHITTEGSLGIAARRQCIDRRLPFTTSYHARFPEYLSTRFPLPLAAGYAWMRWFHRPSAAVMVATATLRRQLETRDFVNLRDWSRGVDTELFRPDHEPALRLPRPVYVYVGRIAVEKNLEAFLGLPLDDGSKLVVGGGPQPHRDCWPSWEFLCNSRHRPAQHRCRARCLEPAALRPVRCGPEAPRRWRRYDVVRSARTERVCAW
jgi:glycosyltransferase involved in cell wall biosynthesis